MNVNIRLESKDEYGQVSVADINADMDIRENDYRLVYEEDLSGEGVMTKSTMLISGSCMRIVRSGELAGDLMYGRALVHNTVYETPYGTIPVTLETDSYDFGVGRKGIGGPVPYAIDKDTGLPDDFVITADMGYRIIIEGQEPYVMHMRVCITSCGRRA